MDEQRQADRAAREGELFRLLVENVVDYAIFVVDSERLVRTWSHGAERLLGYTEDEILGRTSDLFFTPEDVRDDVPRREMQKALATGRGEDDRWHVRKDGTRFWVSGVMTPLSEAGGSLQGFAKIMRDRTDWWYAEQARLESEARFRTVFAHAAVGLAVTDPEGRFLEANPAYCELTGSTLEQLLQTDLASISHPDDFPRLLDLLRPMLDGRIPGFVIETRYVRKDGGIVWVKNSVSLVRDGNGQPLRIIALTENITLRMEAEATVAERQRLSDFHGEIGLALAESNSLREMLDRCADATVRRLDGCFARIWTTNDSGDVLELRASAGMYTHIDGPHARIPVGRYKIGLIALERRPLLTNTVIGDSRVPAQDWAEREGIVAFAGYPLVVGDRLVGVWAMFARHTLSIATLQAMGSVANGIAMGIERNRAAEALAESEAWLSTTLTSIGDAVIATDERGLVRIMNPVAEGLTGWTQAEALGKPLQEVFHILNEHTRHPAESPVDRVIREGVIVGLANHTVVVARNGVETAIEDSAAPIRNAAGQVVGVVLVFQDATQRRRHERELREGEARKAAILQAALDAIVTMDHEGKVVEWNAAAERTFGYERAEVLGREMAELIIPPAHRADHRRGLARYLATGEGPLLGRRIEVTALWADGSEFPVELAIAPIPTGGPPLFTAHLRDVTERRRHEAALRESEERHRSILESISDAFYAFDRNWRFTYVNRTAETLLGRSRDELLGRNVWEVYSDTIGSDFYDAYHRAMDEKVVVSFEAFYPPHDRWFELHAYPSEDGISVYFRDVSARKRDEAERDRLTSQVHAERRHLQTLIESSQDCVKELDLDGRLISISGTGQRLLEIENLCEVLDKPWIDFWQGEDREAARTAVSRALAGGVGSFEGYCPTASGTPKWWDVVVTPIPGPDGTPHRLLSVSRDITDRRRHREERERLLAEAQAANQAKDQFLAMLSHELRTPLNPILLAASSMLERTPDPEEVRPTLEMIRQNVKLQARLIDDLLDVMRIVQGKMPLHLSVSDCHTLIEQSTQICQSDVFGKALNLELDLSAEHHHVNADSARLHQVLWNLVRNAVKFTPEGGTIAIRTWNMDSGERNIVIEVADTGIGIEPNVLPYIFDPFQQGETTITRRFGGLGLGLAICKGVVDAHGGTLTVESEGEGRGTIFRVILKTMPEPVVEARSGGEAEPQPSPPSLNRLNLLLVEDEVATLRLMARLLKGLGHRVTAAGTVADAWEAFRTGDFDMIVSDIGLPDGSGLDLMRKVKAVRQVPAIALTGYGMDEDVRRSREAGFTTHMTKPIDFTKLEAMIRQVAG